MRRILLWILGFLMVKFYYGFNLHIRRKRNLIFTPRNSIVQLIVGTGVPVPLESQQALTLGWVVKSAYGIPNNASYFTNPYVTVQKRSIFPTSPTASRYDIYRSIEAMFETFGGKDCMLRAICEASQVPFREETIIGRILQIILTPSSTNEVATAPTDRMYEAAWRMGSSSSNCERVFNHCNRSILDVFSVLNYKG